MTVRHAFWLPGVGAASFGGIGEWLPVHTWMWFISGAERTCAPGMGTFFIFFMMAGMSG